MPTSYHHGNLRAALLDAAVERARAGGPDAVVLREVARLCGVSHNAAYRHFADREELLAAVGELAMAQLEAAMETEMAAVRTRDPKKRARDRLSATGRAYVTFALSEPGLFQVAFSGATRSKVDEAAPEDTASLGPYLLLNRVLDELAASGAMPESRRPGADLTCWASVHGYAGLHLNGIAAGGLESVDPAVWADGLELLLATLDRGLTAARRPGE